jgi:hypothetical protein
MKKLLITLSLVTAVSCSHFKPHVKPSQGVLCVWPDPISFNLADDNWTICFDIDHSNSTGSAPLCTTVRDLRQMISTRRLTN